jgi:hypothetical protein
MSTERAATMATEKESGRTRRKASAGRDDGERVKAEPARDTPMVDFDPWGLFLEKFWEPAEGGGANRQDGGQKPAKVVRTPSIKSGKKERSPRAS